MVGRKSFRFYAPATRASRRKSIQRTHAIELLELRELLDASSITVVPYQTSADATTLSSALLGPTPNLTILSASFEGADGQAGLYSGFHLTDGTTLVELPDGVLLTTGSADLATQVNNDTRAGELLNGPGDSDLSSLIDGEATYDRASLTIQFSAAPGVKSIQFSFVFGSEEFPEFVNEYNDVFGAYLDGVQISFDTNNAPISVNNNFFLLNNSGDTSDSDTIGKTVATLPIQYDGLTPRITTQRELNPDLSIHTLKLVIADTGDSALDSAVFLAGLSGAGAGSGTGQAPVANAGGPYAAAQGRTVQLDASATTDPDQAAETLEYTWDLDGDGVFGESGVNAVNGDELGIQTTFHVPASQQGESIVALQVKDATGLVSSSSATISAVVPEKRLSLQQLVTPIGSSNDIAHAVAIQEDGKFVVAGYSDVDGHYQFALARYNADATLDTSFSGDGKVITPFGSLNDGALAIALQPDGKIVAAGYSYQGTQFLVALARYNSDGSLDPTFDGDGRVTAAIGTSADAGFSVKVTPQGKVLVAGLSLAQGTSDFGLVQFDTNGSLDKSFGNGGTVRTVVSTGEDRIEGVHLTADGRIVVAGWTAGASGDDVAIARYLPNGQLDTSFNGTGLRKLSLSGGNDRGRGLLLAGDSIMVLAASDGGGASQYSLIHLLANGQLDPNFADKGIARTPSVAGAPGNVAIALHDGKLLVLTGNTLRQYNADGTPDTSFDGDGAFPFTLDWRQGMLNDIDYLADQPVTMVGGYVAEGSYDFAIVRLISDTVPVAVNDQAGWSSGAVDINLLVNDYDLDEGDAVDPTSVTIVTGPAVGTLSPPVNGVVTYTPPQEGFTGTSFRYTVKDRFGVVSNEATVTVTRLNTPPVIISGGGGETASVSVAEHNTTASDVIATDSDQPTQTLTYSIIDGVDKTLFSINPSTGALSFKSPPTFIPNPDGEPDNSYEVIVQVSDGTLTDTQTLTVTVTNTNDPPIITSNGGGATANVTVAEQTTIVTTVTATDADLPLQSLTYSIVSGADSSLFSINPSTGALSFKSAPTFIPNPDGEPDNNYEVTVQVSDGTLTDTQALTVTITNTNDPPIITSNGGGATANVTIAEQTMIVTTVTATDADLPLQSLIYSVVSGADSSLFSITPNTGILSFNSTPAYIPNPDGEPDNNYEVTVQVSDGTLTDTQTITVTIEHVNLAPAFVGTGMATTAFSGVEAFGRGVVIQSDGKFLVAGYTNSSSTYFTFALARYNADDSLDVGFGNGGTVTTALKNNDASSAYALTLQSDGKILVAGYTDSETNYGVDFALVRYLADGKIDNSFGDAGVATTYFGTNYFSRGYSVVVQPDGRILVAGDYEVSYDNSFAIARYKTDGTLDETFAGDGTTTTQFGQGDDAGRGMAIQSDGKIIVVGTDYDYGANDFALARYNTDGSLDSTFDGENDGNGRVTTDFDAKQDRAWDIVVQPDGKILVVGGSGPSFSDEDVLLARYNSDGRLDSTFGAGGYVRTVVGAHDSGYALTLQPDGKIVVVLEETLQSVEGTRFSVLRYNTDGSPDTTFDGDGKATADFGDAMLDDSATAVQVQPDGKILVAGWTDSGNAPGGGVDFAVARFTTGGVLDAGFGFGLLIGTPKLVVGGTPVVLDPHVIVVDPELSAAGNYAGATLTLVRNGGASADDLFSATGNLLALAQGGNLVLSGQTIGTVTTNSNGTLALTFNTNATQAHVNAALQSIAYANNNLTPPATVQISWTFSDGNTGAQGTGGPLSVVGQTTVVVQPGSLAPVPLKIPNSESSATNVATSDIDRGWLTAAAAELIGKSPSTAVVDALVQRIPAGASPAAMATALWSLPENLAHRVNLIYQSILHRNADPAGSAFFVNRLLQGATEDQIALSLVTSAEYQRNRQENGAFVDGLYRDLLGRAADAGGRQFWLNALAHGQNRQSTAESILGSAERRQQVANGLSKQLLGHATTNVESLSIIQANGNFDSAQFARNILASQEFIDRVDSARIPADKKAFVDGLAKTLNGRAATASELALAVNDFTVAEERETIVSTMWNSAEHLGRQVDQLYRAIVHRPAAPADITKSIQRLQSGSTENDIALQLLVSPEYATAHATNDSFVAALYRDLLGRTADAVGKAAWLNQLAQGASRKAVAESFLESDERGLRIIDAYFAQLLGRAADPVGKAYFLQEFRRTQRTDVIGQQLLESDEYFFHWND